MAISMATGTILFEDYKGQQATIKIAAAKDLDAIKDLAESLGKYSRAKIVSASFTQTYIFDNFQQLDFSDATAFGATEHFDRVAQKAKFMFRDADDGRYHSMSLPAPNDNVFDAHQEIKPEVAEDILDFYAAATSTESNDLMYQGGYLIGKKPKSIMKVTTGV